MIIASSVQDSRPAARPLWLREALKSHGQDSILADAERQIPFAALAAAGPLGDRLGSLAGKSVILITACPFSAAVALADLDGVVGRVALAPPDLDPNYLAAVAADAAAEALVFDGPPPAERPRGLDLIPFDPGRLSPRDAPASGAVTEWVLFTSGTSGVPKMVSHSLASLTSALAVGPITARSGAPSTTFVAMAAFRSSCVRCLGSARWCFPAKAKPWGTSSIASERPGVTHLSGTPSHWRRALMSGRVASIAPGVRPALGRDRRRRRARGSARRLPTGAIGHAYASTEAGVGFDVTDGSAGFPARFVDAGRAGSS